MNNIQVSKEEFSKISKRLYQQLKSQTLEENSLSKTQEQLALAFGFRNYNSINTFFMKEDNIINSNNSLEQIVKENVISHNLSEEQFIIIFKSFININKSDMWTNRAMGLIEAIIPALIYMREQEEIILNFLAINEFLILDNIIKLYKTRRDFPNEIRYLLRDYLFSLPSFNDNVPLVEGVPKQNNTVLEQHGYLQMQFKSALLSLIKIDKQSITILPINVVKKITSINNYQNYPSFITLPEVNKITQRWEDWENSNFFSEPIISLIMVNKSKLEGKNLYVHDLIKLSFNYMNEKKRLALFAILFEFINNLTLTKQYSSEVIAIFDK